jgi:hypothetical protein
VIERLTYVCGIAVAVIGWAVGLLVADLTETPVLYVSTKSSDAGVVPSGAKLTDGRSCQDLSRTGGVPTKPGAALGAPTPVKPGDAATRTVLEFRNLSRKGRIKSLTITLQSDENCLLQLRVEGSEWTRENQLDDCSAVVGSLMPGNKLAITVDHVKACPVNYKFTFADAAAVRTIDAGIESFLLENWLGLLLGLVTIGGLIFAIALAKAYSLSESPKPKAVPEPPPEPDVVVEPQQMHDASDSSQKR